MPETPEAEPDPRVVAPCCRVVDDDAAVRSTIARVIRSIGLTSLEAEDGGAALRLLEEITRRYPDEALPDPSSVPIQA